MLKKILTTFAFIMLWCLSTVAWAQTKTLNLNEGRIDIWPDGYTQGVAMSSIDKTTKPTNQFTGDYIITGSWRDDWPFAIRNYSGKNAELHLTLDNATITGADWCSAFVVVGNADIDLYLTVKGNCTISAYNHGPIQLQSPITLYINITETAGGSFKLESRYGSHEQYEVAGSNSNGGKIIFQKNGICYDYLGNVVSKKYVIFNTNGGSSITPQEVESGQKATKPANPTKEGKSFAGWYADADCTTEFDFNTAITEAVTNVYAKWEDPAVASVINGTTTTRYSTFAEALEAWVDGSKLTLLADVEISDRIDVTEEKTFDLNGFGLRQTVSPKTIFWVDGADAKLTIEDSNPTRTGGANRPEGIAGGYITGGSGDKTGTYRRGGALNIDNFGYCKMTGGTFTGNTADFGGAVQFWKGTFEMVGGTITGNSVAESGTYHGGGGVWAQTHDAKFIMGGTAEIYGNNGAGGYYNCQVMIISSDFIISGGSPKIHNSASDNNLFLKTGDQDEILPTVSFTGEPLSTDAIIHINSESIIDQVFTVGIPDLSAAYSYVNSFVSDKPDRAVVVDHPTHQLAFASASYVASISNSETTVYYQTLEAAVTDWVDGTTLHLLKDVETASTITVPAGDHTLDLNGHALKKTGSSGSVLFVGTGANLELVDNHSDGPVHYYTPNKSGLATLSETETEYSFTGGYITGGIGTYDVSQRYCGGGVYVKGGNFTMNGGTIFGNGKYQSWYTGGAVQLTGDGEGSTKGTFTMNGGALIGNTGQFGGAIEITGLKNGKWGHGPSECTINGGVIKHNTCFTSTPGIRVCWESAGWETILNINGGTITENYGGSRGAIGGDPTINISGSPVISGNYTGDDKESNLLIKAGQLNITDALGESAKIGVTMATPGVFTNSADTTLNDLSKFFSDDENYIVRKNADNQLELYIPPVATVTVDGTTTVYTNFAAALEAWVDGSTLQLLSDIETVNTIVAPSGTLTLDLNGHGILMTGGKTVLQVGNSDDPTTNLTMIDSDPNRVHYVTLENYVAKSVADDGTESITDGTGTVKITGGYIAGGQTGLYCVGNRSGETYQAGAGIYVGRATFTMKAGTIIGNKTTGSGGGLHVGGIDSHAIMDGGRICYNCSNSGGAVNIGINGWISHQPGVGKFTMNGGLIDSNYALAQQAGYGGAFRINNGKLHLNGGSIINNKTAGTAVAGILYDHKGGCEGNINYIYVSGNAVLKDNYNANGICNIYLTDGAYITVEGEMGEDASIGVSMQTPGVFTNSTNTDYNDITKFFNDDELYIVRKNDDGQLKLAIAPVATIIASDGTTTEYETLEEALDAWVDGSTLKLIRDVKPTSTITVPSGTLTLDLNGHGILRTGEGSVISVPTDATLNIEDNDNSVHYITLEDYYAVSVSKVGTEVTPVEGTGVVKVIGGYIAGGYYPGSGATPAGAGLHVEGTVNMSGGTIIGNRTENYSGGGIATSYNGSVSLSGDAQVIYNKALGWGGAIYNLGSLSVSDEVAIMHNYGFSAIHQYTSMSISGSPQIYDNVATYTGRGIRVEQKLSIVGPLTGAKISVCLNNIGDQTQSREGQLTLTSEYIDANTAAQFVCENDGESGFTIVRKGQELWVTTGYSVNYLANGGEGTTVDENNPYEKNSTATILENAFTTTEGIQFANWNTKEDGSGDTYKPGDSYKVIGNLTLYAQWKRTTYTFTVTANNSEGGTVEVYGDDIIKNEDGTYTVEPGTEIIIKATAAEGYILSSWSNGAEVNEDGTIKVVVTGAVNIVVNFGRPFAMATNHKAEAADSEVQNGFEIYTYGYCNGSSYRLKYYLSVGEPDQYKVEFDDNRFTDVDWTYLTTIGNEGTIDLNIPADLTTGDYSMKVFFRNSEFLAFESDPIIVSFHVNLPETYTVPLYENVIAVVNTCECLTDIQWYHRDNSNAAWQAISGATDYYYRQVGGLTGEYFISTKMNGVSTYTCPQTDVKTLYGATKKVATVRVSPNPIANDATVSIEDSENFEHSLRIVNIMGKVIEVRTFNGNSTSINLSAYPTGTYLISVDGIGVKVIRK